MFVSEIIPNLWVCDYDVVNSNYFDDKDILLYIHIYSYSNEDIHLNTNYNQSHINIHVKDIINSNSSTIRRQNLSYCKQFSDNILKTIESVNDILETYKGVVIYSKFGIQKAATYACSYLITMGNLDVGTALKIMHSKEPLFFKEPNSVDRNQYIVLYKDTLKHVKYNS